MTQNETRYLPCKLTDAEVMTKGEELAAFELEREKAITKKKKSLVKHNQAIKDLGAKIGLLSEQIETREESRNVPVTHEQRFEENAVVTIRLDTKEEIERRPMDEHDRQSELPN